MLAAPCIGLAATEVVWQAGIDEDPYASGYNPADELAPANYANNAAPGAVTRVPGDPLYNAGSNPSPDDDFYFAGNYPAGFNGLAAPLAVALSEPQNAWPRELHTASRTNRVHFHLSTAQAGSTSRLRLSLELVWGGIWYNLLSTGGEGFGAHDVLIRFRNGAGQSTVLWSNRIDRATRIVVDFSAASVAASAGPNTIEIARVGPNPANLSLWTQFDFASLEARQDALVDGDGDQLPRWWEIDQQLDDGNPADASADLDGDGLNALQEFNAGTNPRLRDTDRDGLADNIELAGGTDPLNPDTDGDSLSDGTEVNDSPASNPLLADSDTDGAPDSLERRVGTNPTNAGQSPTVFRGGIGINFASESDLNGVLRTNESAGVIPQVRWNSTFPVRPWNRPNGSHADIVSPITNQIVRSDGAVVPGFTYDWTGDATGASGNSGSPDRRLMSGFIRASTGTPLALAFSGIPFARYDLHVIVGGSADGQRGRVRLGSDPATDRLFRTATTVPQDRFVELKAGSPAYAQGNLVTYTNLALANVTVNVTNLEGWSLGIHAVQIIDRTLDHDGSGIPDWWELKHALQPGSTALAAIDTDGDTLTNLHEFQRGSDPRRADTDGDGLTDNAESATNALTADSDGDGLSDSAEVWATIPSNPNLADTDGDGVNDKDEARLGTDPTGNSSATFTGWVPRFSASPSRWEWNIENVQLVWDHTAGALAPNIWNEDQLISFGVRNPASGNWRTLGMELRLYNGAITHIFHSESTGAFSASNQPGGNIWNGDYGNPPLDLTTALGFSGHGPADLSDRLQFRMFAQRGASANAWTITFEIRNQTSNTVVVTRTVNNSTAIPAVDNGTAQWSDFAGNTGQPNVTVHQGVRAFITPTPLASLPAFADAVDTDNDGMPDTWEDAHLFNKFSAADATQNADTDDLNNRDEFLAGTNPRLADTDGDGINDSTERVNGSDPLVVASRPLFAGQSLPFGSDLDGNGLPDAWEVRFRAFGLDPNLDADGDGVSNGREAREGTNPFDVDSVTYVTLARDNDDVVIEWPLQNAKNQSLMLSTNLPAWQPFTGSVQNSGGMANVRLTDHFGLLPFEFYHIATSDRDTDGDGVMDWDEIVLGSDATRANSVRAATPLINTGGQVTGSLAGDRAAFIQQMQGGPGGNPAAVTRVQAARLLQQTTFGVTPAELDRVQQLGVEAWLDDQIWNQPPTLHRPYLEAVYADFNGPRTDLTYSFNDMDQFINGNNCTTPFARAAIGGPDQLRQRVAFALSQILVTSRRDPNLENKPLAMTDYYDVFVRNAFGSYFDVLREVTFHPVMGRYLSHIGNQKARPEINQYPDENYAREVMQLFSIGLWELNPDGTRKLDGLGQPIPTYGNAQITEFARVFTGLWFGGQAWGNGGWTDDDSSVPMQMWAEKHDFGEKTLLNGLVIPARTPTVENGIRDVDDAIRNLFDHPNTGPFIGQQLIQFLVTSNPSSEYVERVAAVFADDGSGIRGNLAAVVKAILLDVEARDLRWAAGAPEFGRLKEPVHRAMAVARTGGLDRFNDLLWWTWGEFAATAFQEPGYSPSVFNFFRPGYQPPGLLTQSGLVGPAFQITDSYSSISFPNKLWEIAQFGLQRYEYRFAPDYSGLLAIAANGGSLVDQVNLLFCGGSMSATTRDHLLAAVNQIPAYDRLLRVRLAVYLAAACPEGAVQR